MKYWIIGAGVLALAMAAGVLFLRPRSSPDPQIDGGVRHYEDSHAPKKIESTRITFFSCIFSTYDVPLTDSPIAGYQITLQADSDGGSYSLCRGSEVCEQSSFPPETSFFRQLQQLVSRHDMAQHNGQYYTVSGLPPDYGMKLEVRYASGECIRAGNNQSCFLSLKAMEELTALFRQQS